MRVLLFVLICLAVAVPSLVISLAVFLFNGLTDRENTWFTDSFLKSVEQPVSDGVQELAVQQQKMGAEFWDSYDERVSIRGTGDVKLVGTIFYSRQPSQKWLMCFHGYRTTGKDDFAFLVRACLSDGYNCLVVDQRSHGMSGGRYISLGYLEKMDILAWTDFLILEKVPKAIVWFGKSLGANAALHNLSANQNIPNVVKGVIAENSFSSFRKLFAYMQSKLLRLPSWLPVLPVINLLYWGRFRKGIDSAVSVNHLAHNRLPILFIHRDNSDIIPAYMMYENLRATKMHGTSFVATDSPFSSSVLVNPHAYCDALKTFLGKLNL